MEPVGLAVGVLGLFGLFNTCLDVVNKYDAWKDFGSESRCLTAQFEAQKLRLQKWSEVVGIEDESVSSKHHQLLDDPRTRSNVQHLLLAIKAICGHEQAPSSTAISRVETDSLEGPMFRKHGNSLTFRGSKRQRFNWALRGKEKRIAQVAQFSSLVDDLHSLVPIDSERGEGSKDTRGKSEDEGSWIGEFKQLIERIEHDHEGRYAIPLWLLNVYSRIKSKQGAIYKPGY
ncbi:prion-inhibition and propagation-domain-containing protein [Aspergillus sergii]|uniref:Prion-inhibition and propagation-domain-containing protein n=1 Tax=Aspergillus sergii TaxID=1034303 RepID=A0A5N6WS15_9EURO|nr:prion-inhibition and propagation-domain-containing protein [Aspergillus sergii]